MPLPNHYAAPTGRQAPDPGMGSGYYNGYSNGYGTGHNGAAYEAYGGDGYAGYDSYDDYDSPEAEGIGHALLAAIASALLPGVGHAMAGRRRTGRVLLSGMFVLIATAGIAYVGLGRAEAARIAVDVEALIWIFMGTIVLGIAWAATIVSAFLVNKPGHMTSGQRFVAAFVVGMLCVLVLTPAAVAAYYTNLQRDVVGTIFTSGPDAKPNFFADKPRVNMLLLGSDAATGRDSVRTDTMIVASTDTRTGRTVLFGLPRNLVNVPFLDGTPASREFPEGFNCTDCLLNSVYRYGEEHPDLTPDATNHGAVLLEQAIEATLAIELDYYIIIDLVGFEGVVDALGGIRVVVKEEDGRPIPIGGKRDANGNVEREPSGYLPLGRQTLNGHQALWYARSRFYSDDYHRMARQQCVLGAIARQATPANVLMGYQDLASTAKSSIETDIPEEAFESLVELAAAGKTAKITSVSFDNKLINPSDPDFIEIQQTVSVAIQEAVQDSAETPSATAGSPAPTQAGGPSETGQPAGEAPADEDPRAAKSVDQICQYW